MGGRPIAKLCAPRRESRLMSSNPLGDVFYDDDGLSVTGSEPTFKPEPVFDVSSQPYFSDAQPPRQIQYEPPPKPDAPVRLHEPDDQYVQPERAPRPIQTAPTQHATPAAASAPSKLRAKTFGSTAVKPAVVVMKTPPGQSKLSKARAAARLAASASTPTSAVAKLSTPKTSLTVAAPKEPDAQILRMSRQAPRPIVDQSRTDEAPEPAISQRPKAKLSTPRSSTKSVDAVQEISEAKALEMPIAKLTDDHDERKPHGRRAKDNARMSAADKMRARREMRTSKAGR